MFKKYKYIIIFVLILCLGAFLRFYKLNNQSFIADEYLGINAGYGYHQTGKWVFWDFNNNKPTTEPYTRASIYYRQVAEVFNFLPANEFSGRLVSVFWGIFGIIVIFIISYLMLRNVTLSLISAFLLAVSVSALIFDRKLRMYSMLAPMYFLFSYFTYMALENRPRKNGVIRRIYDRVGLNVVFMALAAIAGYVSLKTHLLTVNILPTVFVYLLVMGVLSYKRKKKYLNKYNVLILLGLAVAPLFLRSHYAKDSLSFFSYNVWSWSYLEKVSLSYSYVLLAAVFFIFGLYYLVKEKGRIGLWISLSFVVPLGTAIYVWSRSAGDQYIYFTEYSRNIIMAAGIYFVAKKLAEKIFPQRANAFVAVIILLVILLINFPFFFSRAGFYENPRKWSYPNYRQIFEYYLSHRKANDCIITRPATSYYLAGQDAKIIGYDEDDKLTAKKIVEAEKECGSVWAVVSGPIHVDGDARKFFKEKCESVETKYTNESLDFWHCQEDKQNSYPSSF